MIFSNGDCYLGTWTMEMISGYGIYFFNNGETYKGEFLDGNKHGYGEYYYLNGNIYYGDWVHGVKHGKGSIVNKQTLYEYVGEFNMNAKSGKGIEKD